MRSCGRFGKGGGDIDVAKTSGEGNDGRRNEVDSQKGWGSAGNPGTVGIPLFALTNTVHNSKIEFTSILTSAVCLLHRPFW